MAESHNLPSSVSSNLSLVTLSILALPPHHRFKPTTPVKKEMFPKYTYIVKDHIYTYIHDLYVPIGNDT
jgi:hypothetical protein